MQQIAFKCSSLAKETSDLATEKLSPGLSSCIEAVLELENSCAALGEPTHPQAQELFQIIKKFIDLKALANIEQEALMNLRQKVLSEPSALSSLDKDFRSSVKKQMLDYQAKSDHQKYDSNEEYVEFKERMAEIRPDAPEWAPEEQDGSDNELAVVSQRISVRCCITAQMFENPYKSSKCQHTYSFDAIKQLILRNQASGEQTECPYYGCQRYVTLKDLVPDKKMQKKLELEKRRLALNQDDEDVDMVV